jgi:hypothetical protein
MTLVNGKMIPSVQLTEIKISLIGDKEKQTVRAVEPHITSKLLPTIKLDGNYLASVDLHEVQVVANSTAIEDQNKTAKEFSEKTEDHFANVSVKQSFNRLMNYFVEKTKIAANKILNSLFRK